LSFYDSSGQSEYGFQKPFSEKTAEKIDEQIRKMVEEAYDRAKSLLRDNREKLDALAQILVEREVIFREDVEAIYGPRPWNEEIETKKEESEIKKEESEIKKEESETKKDEIVSE
jgi:cell division protease FtsH